MDRKTLTILLAAALLGSFFLPYFGSGNFGLSGYDYVFKMPGGEGAWEKYIWLLIPLSAVLLLIGALNNGHYVFGRGLLTWLPLLTLIFIVVRLYMNSTAYGIAFSIGNFVKGFGIGFWVTLVISLLLAFFRGKAFRK